MKLKTPKYARYFANSAEKNTGIWNQTKRIFSGIVDDFWLLEDAQQRANFLFCSAFLGFGAAIAYYRYFGPNFNYTLSFDMLSKTKLEEDQMEAIDFLFYYRKEKMKS